MAKKRNNKKVSKKLQNVEAEESEEQGEERKKDVEKDSLVDPVDVVNAFSQEAEYETYSRADQSEKAGYDVNALDQEYFEPFIRDGGAQAIDVKRLPNGKFMSINPVKKIKIDNPLVKDQLKVAVTANKNPLDVKTFEDIVARIVRIREVVEEKVLSKTLLEDQKTGMTIVSIENRMDKIKQEIQGLQAQEDALIRLIAIRDNAPRRLVCDYFRIGTSRYIRIKAGNPKKASGGNPNKLAYDLMCFDWLKEFMKEEMSAAKGKVQYGYPCIHRRQVCCFCVWSHYC